MPRFQLCTVSADDKKQQKLVNWPGMPLLLTVVVRNRSSERTSSYVSLLSRGCAQERCSDSSKTSTIRRAAPNRKSVAAVWSVWILLGFVAAAGLVLAAGGHKIFRFGMLNISRMQGGNFIAFVKC